MPYKIKYLPTNPDALKVIKNKEKPKELSEPRGAQGDRVFNVMWGPGEDCGT